MAATVKRPAVKRMQRPPASRDKPVTRALSNWSGKYTKAAYDRLMEVIEADTLTADRGDGSGRIRPSSIYAPCPRMKLLSFYGFRSDELEQRGKDYTADGTFGHYRWQLMGLSAGVFSDIEVKVEYAPWRLAGSLDALLTDGTPFEFKRMGSWRYRKAVNSKAQRPYDDHLWQVHGYMKATGTEECSLVYENRDTLEFHEFRVQFDPEIYRALQEDMEMLDEHITNGSMPDILPDCIERKGTLFAGCHWKKACLG